MEASPIDYPRAKSLWAAATGEGSENATTTFHTEWNKNRSSERPYALGYLTQRRFVRFLQSSQGQALLGVDCSRAGAGGGERESFIRRVCSEFFALCVELSKLNEVQVDDYELVGTARNMADGSYCTFPGFASALHSPRFDKMLKQWRKNAIEAPDPIPETNPRVVVGVPVEPASEPPPPPPSPAPKPVPKRNPNPVVDMDSSDEETTAPKYAPPPLPLDPVTRIARKLYKEGMKNAYHRESREWTASNSGAVEFYTIDEWIEPRWQRMPPNAREEWMKAARATLNESAAPPAAPSAAPSAPAPPAPPPPTPVVKPAPEPIVEPEPSKPEPSKPEPDAPAPVTPEPAAPEPVESAPKIASKSKKKRKRDDDQDTPTIAGTEHWTTNALGFLLIQKYNAHKVRAARGDLAFDDKHECRAEVWGDYTFLLTQRQMGRSALKTDGYVLLDGEAASRVSHATRSQPRLRSVPDIVRHFNANPDLNEDLRA